MIWTHYIRTAVTAAATLPPVLTGAIGALRCPLWSPGLVLDIRIFLLAGCLDYSFFFLLGSILFSQYTAHPYASIYKQPRRDCLQVLEGGPSSMHHRVQSYYIWDIFCLPRSHFTFTRMSPSFFLYQGLSSSLRVSYLCPGLPIQKGVSFSM